MSLYGDKITLGSTTAADNLTKSADSPFDGLTKSAGSAFDGLTKSVGAVSDNLLHINSLLTNGNFEGGDLSGLANGWSRESNNNYTIQDPGINGKSQLITESSGEDLDLNQGLGAAYHLINLDLSFRYLSNCSGKTLTVKQLGSGTVIYSVVISGETSGLVNINFTSDNMTGIEFRIASPAAGTYLVLDDVVLEAHKQDNLVYTI